MVENWTDHDTKRRVRALVAGVLTSGALATGALTVAPAATAACTAGESGCPSPADSAAPPTQAERNQATINYLRARSEADRLEAAYQQAHRAYEESSANWNDLRFQGVYNASTDARGAFKVADDKANAAGEVVKQLEKRVAEAAARAAAPKRTEDDREATQWGGPTNEEMDDAVAKAKVAKDEAARLRGLFEVARKKTQYATPLYCAGLLPDYSLLMEAENAAYQASNDAAATSQAADEAVKALQNRAAEAVKKREAQEREREDREMAESKDKARWGGATHDELVEANNRTLALRDEGHRLDAITDKAAQEADAARIAYGPNDPRYLEKNRLWNEAVNAATPVHTREWEAGNYYKMLTERVAAANAAQAEEAQAERQMTRTVWGPSAAELADANKSVQAARDEAAPLQVSADEALKALTDTETAYGASDPRTREKARAFDLASKALDQANQKVAEARKPYEKLLQESARAAARRAPREEAERQAAEAAAAAPDAAQKQAEAAEAAKKKAEADRLRDKAAKAWLDLKHAEEVYGTKSTNYQEKVKVYEEASKLVKPSDDETTNATPAPADSGTQQPTDTTSTTDEQPDAEKPSTEKEKGKRPERAADGSGLDSFAPDPDAHGTDGTGSEATPE
jgi:hypothetical protein